MTTANGTATREDRVTDLAERARLGLPLFGPPDGPQGGPAPTPPPERAGTGPRRLRPPPEQPAAVGAAPTPAPVAGPPAPAPAGEELAAPATLPEPTPADVAALFHALARLCRAAGGDALRVTLRGAGGRTLDVTLGRATAAAPAACEPTAYQGRILEALKGRALHTDALAAALGGDRRRLFRRPGGIHELRAAGLVSLDQRRGYFRPDAPPPPPPARP